MQEVLRVTSDGVLRVLLRLHQDLQHLLPLHRAHGRLHRHPRALPPPSLPLPGHQQAHLRAPRLPERPRPQLPPGCHLRQPVGPRQPLRQDQLLQKGPLSQYHLREM